MSVLAGVWSFILTLVRSFVALFTFRRRAASDPFSLARSDGALARAHSRLRPIRLTPRSIPTNPPHRAESARTHSAASTLLPAPAEGSSASASDTLPSEPQRTSPKLDPHDPELGLPLSPCQLPAASAISFRESPSTSATGSMYVLPLTPPDRCYLEPLPSTTDCPYSEPWPANVPPDRSKPKLPRSSLRLSVNTEPSFPEPMVAPIGSPPPGRWSPLQVWTSTPNKIDSPVPDPFDQHQDASARINLSHAIISRSVSSVRPYDDASTSSLSSRVSPLVESPGAPAIDRHRTRALLRRSKDQPFPRFHHPDAYAYMWRRLPARLPGRRDRSAASRSRSYTQEGLPADQWYDADAYVASPPAALSPPHCDSATDDEDEVPLERVRERLARRILGAGIGLGVPVPALAGAGARMSLGTRRMSEGCLSALAEGTPTHVGVGAWTHRRVFSMTLDGHGDDTKDWLEALSLRYPSEQEDALEPVDDGVAV